MRPLRPLIACLALTSIALGAEPMPDLSGYKTVRELATIAPPAPGALAEAAAPGFAGVEVDFAGVVLDVAPDSPAEAAGLKAGDKLLALDGAATTAPQAAKDRLRGLVAGRATPVVVSRAGAEVRLSLTPRPASKPFSAPTGARAVLGIQSGEVLPAGGSEVTGVTAGSAAEKAGVKAGDVVLKLDQSKVEEHSTLREILSLKKPGDAVVVTVKRSGEELELKATLADDPAQAQPKSVGWDESLPRAWRKPSYRLAILGVEYPDVKHNPKITDADWAKSMFSRAEYTATSATGQKVYGSMADYYREISYGKLKVEGDFLGWTAVKKNRADYSSGSGTSQREKTALLVEALDAHLAAKGADALKDYDGVFFVYAGGRVNTTRGGLYWPHRASVTHKGKRWPYFIVQEGGERMTDISVFCHEFGHMLGLPDLYARPEVPGMEGVGVWCAMSQQSGGGRPQHFSAWSKDQLGWLQPVAIDPRVRQKVVLSPIETDPTQCLKIPVRPDGSEYFLLENRRKTGFDASLPAEGLLIWRVIPGNSAQRVFLEEAHGVAGPTGPRVYAGAVPFPSPANANFTPTTTPSSKSTLGGGTDVYITNIRRLPDGRVTFGVGYEYQ